MAGGPIYPSSALPDSSGEVFPNVHVGATNGRQTEGFGIIASLANDRTLELRFHLPPTLPTGTIKLQILSLSAATSNSVILEAQWFSATPDTDKSDTVTLDVEGDTTIAWSSGDNDKEKLTKITLDASTAPVAGDILVMHIKFDSTTDLTSVSTHQFSIIWE